MKTYIVIPAHNESRTIGKVLRQCKKYGRVIVVDDGSTDNTSGISKKFGATVIKHKNNIGYGKTLHDGIKLALKKKADYIITIDGDGQHDPKDIPRIIKQLNKGYDVVVGSRFMGGKQWSSWKRMLALRMLSLETRIFSGLNLTDVQSGFRGYKSRALSEINIKDFGMGFSVEIPIKINKKGYSFVEVPIRITKPAKIKSLHSVIKQGITVGLCILKYSFSS